MAVVLSQSLTMASGTFRVQRSTQTQLTLQLGGEIDEETVLGCERETRSRVSLVEPNSLHVVWDLRDVVSYSFEARIVLVRLQRFLASKALRTAYIAGEPVARSLALWAAHMAGHAAQAPISPTCIVPDLPSANAWLSEDDGAEPNTGRHVVWGAAPAGGDDRVAG